MASGFCGDKTVVVIPGSRWQVPLVRRLRSEGFKTLVVNPFSDSEAFPYADGHLRSDIFDLDAVEAYCRTEGADTVMSEECDIAMPALAELGERLGFPTLSPASARLFTDKSAMRAYCSEHGFASPEYRVCESAEEASDFVLSLGGRAVVKPLDANSSRGVHIVNDSGEVVEAFADAASRTKRGGYAALVERFVAGTEFTCDGVKGPDGHRTLAISKKLHFAHNEGVANELYFTHDDDEFDYDLLRATNDELIEASGLEFGLTHVEYRFENGKYWLVEMAARGGGNLMSSHIAPFLSGFDNYGWLIDFSLNGPREGTLPDYDDMPKGRCAVLKFFETPAGGGRVVAVEGVEDLHALPEIVELRINFRLGEILNDAVDDSARIGFYIALCENEARLREVMNTVEQTLHIVVER